MSAGPVKVCTGPAHAGPTRIPLDAEHWYFHRSCPRAGEPTSRCRLCANWARLVAKGGPHGLVPADQVRGFALELVERCGSASEAARRHGIAATVLRGLVAAEYPSVQRRTVEALLRALGEQRKDDRRNGSSERFLAARREQAKRIAFAERTLGCG